MSDYQVQQFISDSQRAPDDGYGPEGGIFMVPPSAVFAVSPDHVNTTLLVPVTHERTLQRRAFHHIGDGATDERYADARQAIRDVWVHVGGQDQPLAAALQASHRQRDEIGLPTRFSPYWEAAVHHFHQMVARRLEVA